jgi:hypothetical protein
MRRRTPVVDSGSPEPATVGAKHAKVPAGRPAVGGARARSCWAAARSGAGTSRPHSNGDIQ